MSWITNEAAVLVRGAAGKLAEAFAASSNGQPDASGGNIIPDLETFAIDLVTGVPAHLKYKLPAEKFSTTFSWEGKTWTFTSEVENGVLKLDAVPN